MQCVLGQSIPLVQKLWTWKDIKYRFEQLVKGRTQWWVGECTSRNTYWLIPVLIPYCNGHVINRLRQEYKSDRRIFAISVALSRDLVHFYRNASWTGILFIPQNLLKIHLTIIQPKYVLWRGTNFVKVTLFCILIENGFLVDSAQNEWRESVRDI